MTELSEGDLRLQGPTVLRLLVGAHLRRLREACGISREDAGYAIRASHSKISRMELGRTSLKHNDVADLLTLYGVREAERSTVLALTERAGAGGWWRDYRDVVPDWQEAYLGLEQDAALIRTYEVQLVPQLLQTEDYARTLLTLGRNEPAEHVERQVAVRMRRRRILDPPANRKLWVVMDEAALRRRVGDAALMRAQLEHLRQVAELPHVTLQVLTFGAGGHVGNVGPVTMLRFAETALEDVVYLQRLTGAQYLTKGPDVLAYRDLLNRLVVLAEPATATPAVLRRISAEL
ncbi:helix-turn-helix domain-containing protein [Nonomuraea rhizosphaerae]|uniref:helix-turn-helix domain-containing protein n=1 Tax=Nonomuraea rhizosphaerae TaxID=2665663 RepID=UPI001FEB7706|nr:helix-turn-helix transcriptional regulator [Nonomuraea rhizosphaerae]